MRRAWTSSTAAVLLWTVALVGCTDADDDPTDPSVPSASGGDLASPMHTTAGEALVPVPGETVVRTVAELEAALSDAGPGDVITIASGTYQRDGGDRWLAEADGNTSQPITLRGTRDAILESDSPDGDYGLHVTGSYWRIEGIAIRNATKGIVLDGSVGTIISGVEVSNIGDEGVHFRACSSDGVLRDSFIHDTGVESPQYGEGVYVGSANSNWDKYGCGDNGEDDTEGTLIENNRFVDISAEGADLKEGTDSGTLRNNEFDNVGFSGENSADSAVDAKGNNWLIIGNTVRNPQGAFEDGFQAHSVYEGYGADNQFTANTVLGDVPGFGFGFYLEAGNVATCDNVADGAARGLVGESGHQTPCTERAPD